MSYYDSEIIYDTITDDQIEYIAGLRKREFHDEFETYEIDMFQDIAHNVLGPNYFTDSEEFVEEIPSNQYYYMEEVGIFIQWDSNYYPHKGGPEMMLGDKTATIIYPFSNGYYTVHYYDDPYTHAL